MYEIMIDNQSEVASVNFPTFENNGIIRSCLGFVLIAQQWDMVKKILRKGCIINITDRDYGFDGSLFR